MSVAPISMDVAGANARDIHTTFTGIVHGELRKIAHMRITWVMAVVITVFTVGGQLLLISGPKNAAQMRNAPLDAFYNVLAGDVAIVRVLSGIFILVLAAHVVGLEYQYGTIRVLLARGVGRLHLLSGKIAALTLVGFALMLVESLSPLLNRLSDFIAPPWRSNARYRRASATYLNAAPLSPRERGWG